MSDDDTRPQRDMRNHVIECLVRGGEDEHTILVDDGSFALIDYEAAAVWLVTVQLAAFKVAE